MNVINEKKYIPYVAVKFTEELKDTKKNVVLTEVALAAFGADEKEIERMGLGRFMPNPEFRYVYVNPSKRRAKRLNAIYNIIRSARRSGNWSDHNKRLYLKLRVTEPELEIVRNFGKRVPIKKDMR